MSGYQPFATLRAHIVSGPPAMPVVDRALVEDRRAAVPVAKSATAYLRAPFHITARQRSWMRQERAKGISQRVIADAVGCSTKLVWIYTKDIPPPAGGWPAQKHPKFADRREVLDFRSKNWSYDRIAKHYGVGRWRVYDMVNGSDRHRSYAHIKTTVPARSVVRVSGISARDLRAAQHIRRGRVDAAKAKARHILIWLIKRDNPSASLTQIGKKLGGIDHSSVHHGLRRVNCLIAKRGLSVPDSAFKAARLLWSVDWEGDRA